MKSVLISIQPKWCDLITCKKRVKTVEIRKTRPKTAVPFKCYIYQTKKPVAVSFSGTGKHISEYDKTYFYNERSGRVIGEFVCDHVMRHCEMENADIAEQQSRVKREKIFEYANGKEVFGWHISNLVIYEQPKELSEFFVYCGDNPKCDGCEAHYYSNTESGKEDYCCSVIDGYRPLTRPFQSWGYVEDGI